MAIQQSFGPQLGAFTGYTPQQFGVKPEEEQMQSSMFVGFSPKQVKQLEEDTKHLPINERVKAQSEIYRQVLPAIEAKKQQDQRIVEKNRVYSQMIKEKNPEIKKNMELTLKISDFADTIREKVGQPIQENDEEIINTVVNNLPDGEKLFTDYMNNGNEEIFYAMGIKERPIPEDKGQFQSFTDVTAGALSSTTGLPRFIANKSAEAIGWAAKQLGADEEKVNNLVNSYKQSISEEQLAKEMGADTESMAFQGTKLVGDIVQSATPGMLLKGGFPQLAQKIDKLPLLGRMVAGGLEGLGDTALFNIISEQKVGEPVNLGLGSAIGAFIPGAGAALGYAAKKIAPKLQLSGLLNPSKLTQAKNMLIDEGTELVGKMESKDVGNWMIERGFKGAKDEIVNGLIEYSNKSKGLVDELLASSETTHNLPAAKKALENIRLSIADTPGLESKLANIDELLSKQSYTLSDLNKIKRELDDVYNLYTKAGGETAGLKAEGLRNIRQDIRKYIENEATKEGLGNIKMLNNETAVSKTLADAISKKESADVAREMLSMFAKGTVGGAIGTQTGPFKGDSFEAKVGNFIIGSLAGSLLFSTKAKTILANSLRKLSGLERKELERFIMTEGKERLSGKTIEKISNIVQETKALPSLETVSTSNIGTPQNPIVSGSPIKKDIIELPIKKSEGLKTKKPLQEKIPENKVMLKAPEETITLYRGSGGEGFGGQGEALRGKGTYYSNSEDVAKHYGKNISKQTVSIKDVFDGNKPLGNLQKDIVNNLPENMKKYLSEDMKYTYNSLIKEIEGNTGLDGEQIAEVINKQLKSKGYKGVKYNIGQVSEALQDKGLGNNDGYIFREEANSKGLMPKK